MARYAIVSRDTLIVENVVEWDGASEWRPEDGYEAIASEAACIGWVFSGGKFSAPQEIPQKESREVLEISARMRRDQLMKDIYDPKINLSLRELRLASSSAQKLAASNKIADLDKYATLLQGIPDQEGFPEEINWPEL